MIKKVFLCVVVSILVIGALVAMPKTAEAADSEVGPGRDYLTIQEAVDHSSYGDTITVYDSGTTLDPAVIDYVENINVDVANLTIIAAVGEDVTVQAANADDHVFAIYADGVTIEGFTITGATEEGRAGIYLATATDDCEIRNNTVEGNRHGISLSNSDDNTILSNTVGENTYGISLYNSSGNQIGDGEESGKNTCDGNSQFGILLQNSNYNQILNNTASDSPGTDDANTYGISLSSSDHNEVSNNTASDNLAAVGYVSRGIRLVNSDDNEIIDNDANNNSRGIRLVESYDNEVSGNEANNNEDVGINLWLSDGNTVSDNYMNSNDDGIVIYESSSNVISNNEARSNWYAIVVTSDEYSSNDNVIYLNDFSSNNNASGPVSSNGTNTWYSPSEITYVYNSASFTNHMGNYWGSDYDGVDNGVDGIGDTQLPYSTDGDGDWYPLTDTPDQYTIENTAPIAVNDTATVAEGGTVTELDSTEDSVLANDSDLDGDNMIVNTEPDTDPSHGTVDLSDDGTFTYTHDGSENFSDSFTYEVYDDGTPSMTSTATVTITITPVNDAPVAVADEIIVAEGGTVTELDSEETSVLANDSDPEGDNMMVNTEPDTGPSHGTLTLNADGTFTYTHDGSENFNDSFTYEVYDDGTPSMSSTATVTITITPVNDAPVAVDDPATTDEGGTAEGNVLTNDSDPEDSALAVNTTPVSGPSHGTVTLNADGTFTYINNGDESTEDSFVYEVYGVDDPLILSTATVTITITPVNDAPVAVDDDYDVDEGKALNIAAPGILTNDQDADGDSLSTELVEGPSDGTLTTNEDGSFTYTPNAGFVGTDTFTYLISDGTVDSNVATVTITVKHVNSPPVPTDDAYTIDEGGTLTVDAPGVLDNDADDDGDSLTTILVSLPEHGDLVLNEDGSFTYTANAGFSGTDSFTYRAYDGTDSVVGTVTITVESIAEAASDDSGISFWVWVAVALGIFIPAVVVFISIRRRAAA